MLTKKQVELIQLLAQSKEIMSSEQISDRLGLSAKTIGRYIEAINQSLKDESVEIASMRGYGYVLQGNMKLIGKLVAQLSMDGYDRRIKDITVYLLSKDYVVLEEVGEALFYSTSMMNKMVSEVKTYLALYQVTLTSKPHYGVTVTGNERDIRSLMMDCGFDCNPYGELVCFLKNILEEEFASVKDIVITFLHRHNIVIADDEVSDLLMRMLVILSRCKQRHYLEGLNDQSGQFRLWQLLQEISAACHESIPVSEIAYLSMYTDIMDARLLCPDNLNQEDVRQLVTQVLEKMREIYDSLAVSNTVRESLILHLTLMLKRIHHKHYVKNNLLQDIKGNYMLEMNYAITFGKMIGEQFGITVPEDELAYLAIYFALNNNQNQKVKRVIIVCNYGVATSQLIREQIGERFPQLEVVGIYPLYYLEVIMKQEIDLIISTIALDQEKVKKPLVVIKKFLDDDALNDIKRVIEEPDDSIFLQYFDSRAFFLLKSETKEEALGEMAERMKYLGFFDEETIAGIYEREAISSTDIGNLVAIPHTIMEWGTSMIGIGILEKPILWDKEKVQVIFMTGMLRQDAQENNVFRHLFRIIKNVFNINHLISEKQFASFQKMFR